MAYSRSWRREVERASRIRVVPASGVAVLEPSDDPVGDQRITPDPGVGQRGAVLVLDPSGEAELVQRVGVEVGPHRRGA